MNRYLSALAVTSLIAGCTIEDPTDDDDGDADGSGGSSSSSDSGSSGGSASGGTGGDGSDAGMAGDTGEGGDGPTASGGSGGAGGVPSTGGSGGGRTNATGGSDGDGASNSTGGSSGGTNATGGSGGDGASNSTGGSSGGTNATGGSGGEGSTSIPPGGTRVVIWEEDFEHGDADWTVEGGEWAIGVPHNGSNGAASARPLAHGGDNLATTGLTANYGLNRDARLIGPRVTIPEANVRPRLRYWYWTYFEGADQAKLQIRVVGGEWQDLETFVGADRVWAQQIVDLRAFAGQTIELGFHLVTDASVVATGLFVDDISIETGALAFSSPEGFEDGFGDWSVEGGDWAIGVPYNGSNGAGSARPLAHDGDNVAATGINANYQNNRDARLLSPEFIVPAGEREPTLRYYSWSYFAGGDYVQLQIRPVGGDWEDLSNGRFDQTNRNWSPRSTDLAPYAGQLVQVGFRLVTNESSVATGLFIDDVSVQTN